MPFSTRKKKILSSAIILLLVAAGVFGLGRIFGVGTARADNGSVGILDVVLNPDDVALYFAGKLVQGIVWIGGQILAVLMWVLFKVAKYNNFIGSTAVVNGWFIARDICNIFFVVIFLVMTVATVLGIESYHYSRILTKLLIMVVLINFSKLICGIFIDVAQVIMLTFMNSFGELGSGYLTNILGITQLLEKAKINIKQGMETSFFTHFGSYLLVLIYVVVAIATILVITLVLVQRIIMLWIYVILSPFAYMLSAFPAGASYSSKWWDDFVKYVTIGPIIAFFVWLSFVSLGNVKTQNTFTGLEGEMSEQDIKKETASLGTPKDIGGLPQAGETEAGSPSHMVKFIFGIAMLIGGLMVAQTIGGMAGSFAGSTIKNLQEGGIGIVKGGFDKVNLMQAKKTGQDLHLGRRWADLKAGFARKKTKNIADVYSKAKEESQKGGIRGFIGSTGTKDFVDQKLQGFLWRKGFQEAVATSGALSLGGRLWKGSLKNSKKEEKDAEKKIETLEKEREKYITTEEEKNKLEKFAKNEGELNKKRGEFDQLNEELTEAIEDLGHKISEANFDNNYQLAAELRGEMKEAQNKQKEVKANISKNTDELNEIISKRQEYRDKKARGEIAVDDKEAQNRIQAIEDQEVIKNNAINRQRQYMTITPETDAVARAAMAAAAKNLPDTSGELRDLYFNAKLQGDAPQIKAILTKLAQNDDLNDLLQDLHYGELPGWTEKDVKQWRDEGKTEEDIEALKARYKGLNNFMRDELDGILPEQQILALQSDVASIAKKLNNAMFMETVKSRYGQYEQNDMLTQQELATIHLSKKDPEDVARKSSRWGLGGGIDPHGNYRTLPGGFRFLIANADILNRNIEQGHRVPPNNILMMAQPENMKAMKDVLETLVGVERQSFGKLINNIEKFAEQIKAGNVNMKESIYKFAKFLDEKKPT